MKKKIMMDEKRERAVERFAQQDVWALGAIPNEMHTNALLYAICCDGRVYEDAQGDEKKKYSADTLLQICQSRDSTVLTRMIVANDFLAFDYALKAGKHKVLERVMKFLKNQYGSKGNGHLIGHKMPGLGLVNENILFHVLETGNVALYECIFETTDVRNLYLYSGWDTMLYCVGRFAVLPLYAFNFEFLTTALLRCKNDNVLKRLLFDVRSVIGYPLYPEYDEELAKEYLYFYGTLWREGTLDLLELAIFASFIKRGAIVPTQPMHGWDDPKDCKFRLRNADESTEKEFVATLTKSYHKMEKLLLQMISYMRSLPEHLSRGERNSKLEKAYPVLKGFPKRLWKIKEPVVWNTESRSWESQCSESVQKEVEETKVSQGKAPKRKRAATAFINDESDGDSGSKSSSEAEDTASETSEADSANDAKYEGESD